MELTIIREPIWLLERGMNRSKKSKRFNCKLGGGRKLPLDDDRASELILRGVFVIF